MSVSLIDAAMYTFIQHGQALMSMKVRKLRQKATVKQLFPMATTVTGPLQFAVASACQHFLSFTFHLHHSCAITPSYTPLGRPCTPAHVAIGTVSHLNLRGLHGGHSTVVGRIAWCSHRLS